MKKIKKLDELKNLSKGNLIDQMLIGTIKGGSSCGVTSSKADATSAFDDAVTGTQNWSDPV